MNNNVVSSIKKQLFEYPKWKDVEKKVLKEENKVKTVLEGRNEPIYPGTLFLLPTQLIVNKRTLDPVFPEDDEMPEAITSAQLPFELSALQEEIEEFFNPPPKNDDYVGKLKIIYVESDDQVTR